MQENDANIADQIELVLEKLRPALGADGFELTLESIDQQGSLVVSLTARDGACADCLVPDSMISQIISNSLADAKLRVTLAPLVKRGFPD